MLILSKEYKPIFRKLYHILFLNKGPHFLFFTYFGVYFEQISLNSQNLKRFYNGIFPTSFDCLQIYEYYKPQKSYNDY
jgi:hypothetical protein